MSDTERSQDERQEEQASVSGAEDASSASGFESGPEEPTAENDPPIISSGG